MTSGLPPMLPAGCGAEISVEALRQGLDQGEIGVHYQPIVSIARCRPVMVEALARWHRGGAVIAPDAFIPLAERAGLDCLLSARVVGRAMAEIAPLWARLRLGVSINLPLAQLLRPDLATKLRRDIARHGLDPRRVALELTETTPVRDSARLHRVLLRLRGLGFRVLLDDVLPGDPRAHLFDLPFAGLKLDRSLVRLLPGSASMRETVRRLVRRAERRGQVVIAEGVSDRRIWSALRGLGVHYAQGFAVGHPLPSAALPGWWACWRSGRQP